MSLEALTACNLVAITESDSTVYDPPLKFLLIMPDGTGGNVVVENEKGDDITIPVDATMVAAILIPGRIRRVLESTTFDDAYLFGIR
jgi:hypothetical protein